MMKIRETKIRKMRVIGWMMLAILLVSVGLGGCGANDTSTEKGEQAGSVMNDQEGKRNEKDGETKGKVNPLDSPTPEGYARVKIVDDEGILHTLEQSISRPLQLPIDFPYPLPSDEITVLDSDRGIYEDGQITYHTRIDVKMELDELLVFYEKAMAELGAAVTKKKNEETDQWFITADKPGPVTIMLEDSYDSSYWVTISTVRQ